MRVRRHVQDALDQNRAAPRNLLGLPPVLYRAAEAKGIDTEGRVERFNKKFGLQTSEQRKTAEKAAKATKAAAAKKTVKAKPVTA